MAQLKANTQDHGLKDRVLKITFRTVEGVGMWVVIDKTNFGPYEPGPPILFAAPASDMCHAWLARQRYGAPKGKLVAARRDLLSRWYIRDEGQDVANIYTSAKTKRAAMDCIRVILRNDAPLNPAPIGV